MKTFIIIPVNELVNPKTRLGDFLTSRERINLVIHMVRDVLNASRGLAEIIIVSPTDFRPILEDYDFHMVIEEKKAGLNRALEIGNEYAMENGAQASIYLPADIPRIRREELERVLLEGEKNPVVLVPASKKGVGAVLRKPPHIMDIKFTSQSLVDLKEDCKRDGIRAKIVDCPSMYFDLDNMDDIKEFLKESRDILTYSFLKGLKKKPLT